MPMPLKSFRGWIRKIYATRDGELDCNELQEIIPQYVDMEVDEKGAEAKFPQVKHHLKQCPDCYDLYVTLRDVARLEKKKVTSELADV